LGINVWAGRSRGACYIQEQEKEDQRLDQLTLMPFERLTATTNRFERFTNLKPPALPEVADLSGDEGRGLVQ
jgi:hypothetical protein